MRGGAAGEDEQGAGALPVAVSTPSSESSSSERGTCHQGKTAPLALRHALGSASGGAALGGDG